MTKLIRVAFWVSLLLCFFSTAASAQETDVRVLTKNGELQRRTPIPAQARVKPIWSNQPTPSPLSGAQLAKVTGKQVSSSFLFRLGQLAIPNKGFIILTDPLQVQDDEATMVDKSNTLMTIFAPTNNTSYIVDCVVVSSKGTTLTLTSDLPLPGDEGPTVTWKTKGEKQHITFLLNPDTLLNSYGQLRYELTLKGNSNWGFYSCSVNQVQ